MTNRLPGTQTISVSAIGPKGAGKTTLLKFLQQQLACAGVTSVLVRGGRNEWLDVELPPNAAAGLLATHDPPYCTGQAAASPDARPS
ncbi:hypothetical protein RHODGE_RHODGE_03302 [Rhodoplanes serenus]|uniref:Uncharacterized protein n=1 Tax=Rhodoplanes serenus TaxID=200615 RepID=A0A3S4B2E3_9BRAD|nr:hypothetical protein [Rhodoplanes serenus]VCU10116.1 hypothetical protein RHODGE_RHODGE_03302 [Rhodoplanes serenus]